MVTEYVPDSGDLIKLDLGGGQIGHEQAGWRPGLVLSPRGYNKKTRLAVVVPVTNATKGYPFEVGLPAGLKIGGTILADAVRSIAWGERRARYFDKVPAEVLKNVQARLAVLLGLAKP